MKKLNKVAVLFASAALATAAAHAQTTLANGSQVRVQAADGGNVIDNWQNGSGELIWVNGTNELCWRNAFWTPATAALGCDGALVAKAPERAPQTPPAPPPAPAQFKSASTSQFDGGVGRGSLPPGPRQPGGDRQRPEGVHMGDQLC